MLTEVALCGEVRARTLLAPLPNGLATQLFAYLVLHRHRPVQHAALVDALWSNARPRDPRAVVSSLLSRLRRSLGPDALPLGSAVRLVLPAEAVVDVDEAADALAAARAALAAGDAERAWERAGRAREIAGRGLLVGFDARWIDPWRADVEATHLDALELVARAGAELGGEHAREGERAARHAIARAPLRESSHAALMETLAALDESAAALQVYEQLRRRLDAELGAIPSPAVRELHQRLLQGEDGESAAALALDPASGTIATGGAGADDSPALGAGPDATPPVVAAGRPPAAGPSDPASDPEAAADLRARLTALGPETAALARRAAALGEVAAVELLVALDDADRHTVLAALQRAFDDGLLAPVSSWLGPAVRFPHAPDADALLAELPETERARIAARAVALLEESDGDRVAIARLALRAVPAIGRDEAVRRGREGVALLLRGRAFGAAAELAERTLEIGPGRRDRVALLLDVGRALRRDDPDRAWRAATSAYTAAQELGDPELLARAALATGGAGRATQSDGGLARRLRAALAALPERHPLRAQLLARLAMERSWSDPLEAEQLADEAARLASSSESPLALRAHARIELAQIDVRREPERARLRLDRADALAARARAEGDRAVEVAALLQRLPLLGELGRAAAVTEDLARLEELGRALEDRHALRVAADVRAVMVALAGEPLAPGEPGAARSGAWSLAPPAPGGAAESPKAALDPPGWRRVRLRLARGTAAAVLGEADDLARLQPTHDGPRAFAILARLLAGDRDEAQQRLERWHPDDLAELARCEGAQLHARTALGFAAARLGDRERAVVLHALLEPFADRHAVSAFGVYLAPVARALGELAGVLGRPQEARERFRLACAAAETIGARAVADAIRRESDPYAPPVRDRL